MSDFFNDGWSYGIAVATVLSLIGCLVLLAVAARRKVIPGDDTTGHVWDGDLRELNNPLPRWWMWLFVITVLFSFVYLAFYPGLGSAAGIWQWSSTAQHRAEIDKAREAAAPFYARFANAGIEQLARDPQAHAAGERLFMAHCATCHGSDARGSKGFPNLADTDWLHGGSPEKIRESITLGRIGTMPPMAAAVGSGDDVRNLAQYVLSLSGSPHNAIAAHLGRSKFGACAACHGVKGQGNPAIGAPNLADKVWLHGWGEEAIVAMINGGKTNVMPAHGQRLSPEQIELLTAFVWSLSQPSGAVAGQ